MASGSSGSKGPSRHQGCCANAPSCAGWRAAGCHGVRTCAHLDGGPVNALLPRAAHEAAQLPAEAKDLAQLLCERRVREEALRDERVHKALVRVRHLAKILRRRGRGVERGV